MSFIGSVLNYSASKDASDAQVESAELGIEEQRAARLDFEERTQPFLDIGLSSAPELQRLLGLPTANPEVTAINAQIDALRSGVGGTATETTAPGRPGGVLFSAGEITTTPADPEILAQITALEAQRDALPQTFESDPLTGLDEINPVVSFLRDEGFEDIQESAAASGRLGAGGTLNDLTRLNNNLAATVAPQLQNQKFNQLFSLLGLGSNAATGQGNAALGTASNIGNLMGAQGAAQASGSIGQANALTNGINNIAGAAGAFPNLFGGGGTPSASGSNAFANSGSNFLGQQQAAPGFGDFTETF